MDVEKWIDISGYNNFYFVSNYGRIKSMPRLRRRKEKILKTGIINGYLRVVLYFKKQKKYKLVHRLVAEAFIPNPENKSEVNHKDGNKKNNNVSNLEWVTKSENAKHSFHILGNKPSNYDRIVAFGKDNYKSKKVYQYSKSGKFINEFDGVRDAGRITGIDHRSISAVASGSKIRRSAGGYVWKYQK